VIEAVSVDFDGVIHDANNGWQDGIIYGDPIPGSLEALKELMLDHPVFIMTARPDLEPVAQWLAERGFDTAVQDASSPKAKDRWHTRDVLLVTNVKLPALVYIDDKALRFTDWSEGGKAALDDALDPRPRSWDGTPIGFHAPCEYCPTRIWVDREDDMDNRHKAYVCDTCSPPSAFPNPFDRAEP
jgi:hypothetical protein